jgi:hypothetical protein
MSEKATTLLHKAIQLEFDGECNRAFVTDVFVDYEYMEVIVNPNQEDEFYAELYFDNYGEWKILEVYNV